MRGGIEAVYDDMPSPIGMLNFAAIVPARGPMFGSRARAGRGGAVPEPPSGVSEHDLYRDA